MSAIQLRQFMGIKAIVATEMTYGKAVANHGVRVGPDPSGVERTDKTPGYLVVYEGGYKSWSPHDEFVKAYKNVDELTFGLAITALTQGFKISNADWNGKDMWIAMSCDHGKEIRAEDFWSPHSAQFAKENGGTATVLPSILMKTASGKIQMGWTPSIADIFGTKWYIVQD